MKGVDFMGKLLTVALVFVFFLGAAYAEELEDVKKEVEWQKKVIEGLEKRVEELEKEGGAARGQEAGVFRRFGINLGIFGDINFSTRSNEKENNGFSLGAASLYSTANIGERLNFLVEVGVEFDEEETNLDIERLWAGYTFSDLLIVRFGRHHTAMGYWNRIYHHGKLLFYSIDRPFFLQFEDSNGVIPIHIVGLELSGSTVTPAGRITYDIEAGNGPELMEDSDMAGKFNLNVSNAGDGNNSKQAVARVSFEPTAIEGLKIGVFGTNFKVEDSTMSMHEAIFGADVYYKRGGFELVSEYFRLKNGGTPAANAYYIRVAHEIGEFVPYLRYETLDGKDDDPYLGILSGGADRSQYIAGVRYDVDPLHSAIKAQYRYDDTEGEKLRNVFELQWAFHF